MEIQEDTEHIAATDFTVGIAVKESRKCKNIVNWALQKFSPEKRTVVKLLHVLPKLKMVPTPMGNYIPISQVREDVALAYKKEMEWKAQSFFLPYKKMCSRQKVEAEIVLLESDDVPGAIMEEITKLKISRLVVGASSRNIITRKISATQLSSRISASIPSFCTVYVISKGKLFSVKPATNDADGTTTENTTEQEQIFSDVSSTSTNLSSSLRSDWGDEIDELPKTLCRYPSMHPQRDHTYADTKNNAVYSRDSHSERLLSSYTSLNSEKNHSLFSDEASSSVSDSRTDFSHSSSQDLSLELERLRVKLHCFKDIYDGLSANTESAHASQKVQELKLNRIAEEIKQKEMKARENNARNLAITENEYREKSEQDAKNSVKIMSLENGYEEEEDFYRYSWEEIETATSSFSEELIVGRGSNGTVYKGKFRHTVAAVKVLHSLEGYGTKQLKQEIKILSKIRHPHLLLLLGACPERGCLIYEYMENGTLDDRLHCRRDAPPLQWRDRFRIAFEVATALSFLHSSKPRPVIHRDLKPANILLARDLASKIGDCGLSVLTAAVGSRDTAPVGTFWYIDPEYQHTGRVDVRSDVYALGVVMLQLLTGRSPVGLTALIEEAIERGELEDLLDKRAGNWPVKEATEMALIGLKCAELRQKDRPDLSDSVVPVLERLKEFAKRAREEVTAPPSHFICPILQEVMEDPCVASDGYTYDRKSIELWLRSHEKSPMTNCKLPNKNLIPNHSLHSAILEWKSSGTHKRSPS